MKKSIQIFTLLLVSVATSTMSCNKEEEKTTGDLTVYAEDINGSLISNETVYLYNNEADFNNVIYSDSEITSNTGKVTFQNLNPGVYYVDCDFDNNAGGTTTISGQGSVSANHETTITIYP